MMSPKFTNASLGSLLFCFALLHILRTLRMRFPALGPFLGFANHYVVAVGARDGALNQKQIVALAHLDHLEILGRPPDLPHMTRHFHAAHDRPRKQSLTDGARTAMPAFGAVCRIAAPKMMPLNYALEAATLRHTNGVNVITRSKQSRTDDLARLDLF